MTFGEQIKQGREEQNLTQEELAERIGVSRQAVSKWESGLSVPRGENRAVLCQLLSLDWVEEAQPPRHWKLLCASGWIATVAVFLCLLALIFHMRQTLSRVQEPSLQSVRFFDRNQEEILPTALWYPTETMGSILVQFSGDTPDTVKLFFTPSGSETIEQTELLYIKTPADGTQALLFPTVPLHRSDLMGHLYLELHYGGQVITSPLYNVAYHLDK